MRERHSRSHASHDEGARFTLGYRERRHGLIGTTAALIMGGLSAAGAIGGAAMGAHAAKSAAQIQADAAKQAGEEVVNTTNANNPLIREAADKAMTSVTGATEAAATGVEQATGKANELLDPYARLGTEAVNALGLRLPELTKAPTMDDLQIDPGFAFRLSEGQKAVARSAAARGGTLGGAAVKQLTRYSQDYSSAEYQKAVDRYRAFQSDAYSRLRDVTGLGMAVEDTRGKNLIGGEEWAGTARVGGKEYAGNLDVNASNAIAANAINAARAHGEFLTQGANAKAAGEVGGANAWTQGISGATGSIMNALVLSSLGTKGAASATPAGPPPGWEPALQPTEAQLVQRTSL